MKKILLLTLLLGACSDHSMRDRYCTVEQFQKADHETAVCAKNGYLKSYCFEAAFIRNCPLLPKEAT